MFISDLKNNMPINLNNVLYFYKSDVSDNNGISKYLQRKSVIKFIFGEKNSLEWIFEFLEERDKVYELILAKYTQNIWDLDADDPKHAGYLPDPLSSGEETMENIKANMQVSSRIIWQIIYCYAIIPLVFEKW